jgi:hypothetical protein
LGGDLKVMALANPLILSKCAESREASGAIPQSWLAFILRTKGAAPLIELRRLPAANLLSGRKNKSARNQLIH